MATTHKTTQYKRGIGAFRTVGETERALQRLQDAGIDMNRVTVIAPDTDARTIDTDVEVESHGNKADEGATAGAVTGGALGSLTGLLVGLGALAIPGIGPILLAGAGATALATTLAGTAIGAAAGGIIGGLIGLGIPEDQAKIYNDHLKDGHYLILVTGAPGIIDKAETIVRSEGIHDWEVYDAPDVEADIAHQETQPLSEPHTRRETATRSPATPVTSTTTSGEPPVVIVDKRDDSYRSH
jgi:uncharacterized membrane protein